MKSILTGVLFVFGMSVGTSAFALSTLKIPVYDESGRSAAKINQALKKNRLPLLPLYLVIDAADDDVAWTVAELDRQVKKATAALGDEQGLRAELFPGSESPGTCYSGTQDAAFVVDLVFALTDVYYSQYLLPLGWKYKDQSVIGESFIENEREPGETERHLVKSSKLWREWRGQGEAILLLTTHTDSSDDINTSIISKCE